MKSRTKKYVFLATLAIFVASCSSSGLSSSVTSSSSEEPSSSSIVITRLVTPAPSYDGTGTVNWPQIENAEKYEVEVNDASQLVNTNNYSFTSFGTYVVRVRAIADSESNFLSSFWSTPLNCEFVESIVGYIILNTSSVTIKMNEVFQLTPSLSSGTVQGVEYAVNKTGVITINNGLITPVGLGNAIVTATKVGYTAAHCYVEVNPALYFELGASLQIDEGDSLELNLVSLPSLTSGETLSFSSSHPQIAFVGATGIISGLSVGQATITATCSNGASATIEVTVNEVLPAILTFNVTIPVALESGYEVYLVGSFNNWTVTDPLYKLTKSSSDDRVYTATFDTFIAKTSISYKYILKTPTSYCWEAYNGDNLANRGLTIVSGVTTITDQVTVWQAPVV